MTVFFSSHQIAEVEQIADHVAIIDRGRAVVAGALDDLRERYRRMQLVFDGDAPEINFPRRARTRPAAGPRADGALERRRRRSDRGARDIAGLGRGLAGQVERNLSRIRHGGGLTCSGTKRGSKPGGGSSAAADPDGGRRRQRLGLSAAERLMPQLHSATTRPVAEATGSPGHPRGDRGCRRTTAASSGISGSGRT